MDRRWNRLERRQEGDLQLEARGFLLKRWKEKERNIILINN